MLYYKFKNYEEFKELFGIVKHGNGNKSGTIKYFV